MNKIKFSFVIAFLISATTIAQNVGINATGATPNASAMLDIVSTSGGLLVPRMTNAQKNAIGTPADGLLVYQTDAGTMGIGFYYYSSAVSAWLPFLSGWALLGNSGTNDPATPATYGTSAFTATENWLGTTDANDLTFGTNSIERMRIKQTTGNVGIGIAAPTSLLHVNGITGNTEGTTIGSALTQIQGNNVTKGSALLIQSSSMTTGWEVEIDNTNTSGTGAALGVTSAGATAILVQSKSTTNDAVTAKITNSSSGVNAITADVTGGNGNGNAISAVSTGTPNISTIFATNNPTKNGTAFDVASSNHSIYGNVTFTGASAARYSFGLYGVVANGNTYGSGAPYLDASGGVIGYYGPSSEWGALGYMTAAQSGSYGGYFANITNTTGTGAGRLSGNSSTVHRSCGIGSYGDLFGGWMRGSIYGLALKGDRASLYVDGKTIVSQPVVELAQTGNNERTALYGAVSQNADIYERGTINLVNGVANVRLSELFIQQVNADDISIIITPMGVSQGVYTEMKEKNSFLIKENNNGTSSIKVSYMVIASRNIDKNVPGEIKSNSFDANLENFMHNENDTSTPGGYLWWDGQKLNTTSVPEQPK